MAYSDFRTVKDVVAKFPITVLPTRPLFTALEPIAPSQLLRDTLAENVPLALNINTEKARSELIITPVLVEVRKLMNRQVSFFSGIDFTVNADLGLAGYCDYVVSDSSDQLFLNAPIVCMVEAKNDNIRSAYGQCLAEMVAAQYFNQIDPSDCERNLEKTIWGAVTTGNSWRFLRLAGNEACIDYDEYLIIQIDEILSIFQNILTRDG